MIAHNSSGYLPQRRHCSRPLSRVHLQSIYRHEKNRVPAHDSVVDAVPCGRIITCDRLRDCVWFMQVSLNLQRAQTPAALRAFDIERDIAPHSAEAAVALFVADALTLSTECTLDTATQRAGQDRLAQLVLSNRRMMTSALAGGVACTLRAAAFSAMLTFLPHADEDAARNDVATLQWAAEYCLRGNVGAPPWSLADLMFALEALVVHWEGVCRRVWADGGTRAFCDDDAPLGVYLRYLWRQCRRFVVGEGAAPAATAHTLPYPDPEGGGHCVAVAPKTVTAMCEVWRQVEAQRRVVWDAVECFDALACAAAETTFLRVFAFEKQQLNVNKFREDLRARLARRFLMLGDEEIWSAQQGGKDVVVDLVVGARCTQALPGFLQRVAAGWTFEQMQTMPAVRDCLYRFMTDSAFYTATQLDFSSRFFEDVGIPVESAPRRRVWVLKRLCHGFVVMWCDGDGQRRAATAPLPFAAAFVAWARRAHAQQGYQYGPEVLRVARKFNSTPPPVVAEETAP